MTVVAATIVIDASVVIADFIAFVVFDAIVDHVVVAAYAVVLK